jgi:glycosyltransferase involved in cell wall biosynthesis
MSILIPTYNRSETLQRTLDALTRQTVDADVYEIVVVDDASTDDTRMLLASFARQTDKQFRYAVLERNGGPAKARNVGLSMIHGRLILIMGDDIEPHPQLINRHLHWHREHPDEAYALLGRVQFPDALEPSRFMRWLEYHGRRYYFNYHPLKPDHPAAPVFFYTCNVSVKASLLEKSGWFDESFPFASHEDLELAERLAGQGMRLIYHPAAKGYHWHTLTIAGITKRVYRMGFSAHIYWRKVGCDGATLTGAARRVVTHLCATPCLVRIWRLLKRKPYSETRNYPLHWHVLLFLSFYIGLSDAWHGHGVRSDIQG